MVHEILINISKILIQIDIILSFLCVKFNYSRLRCTEKFKKEEQTGNVSDHPVTLSFKSKISKLKESRKQSPEANVDCVYSVGFVWAIRYTNVKV